MSARVRTSQNAKLFDLWLRSPKFYLGEQRPAFLVGDEADGSLWTHVGSTPVGALVTQSVEYWSYEPKVMGSSPI